MKGAFSNNILTLNKANGTGIDIPLPESGYEIKIANGNGAIDIIGQSPRDVLGYPYLNGVESYPPVISNIPIKFSGDKYIISSNLSVYGGIVIRTSENGINYLIQNTGLGNLPDGTYTVTFATGGDSKSQADAWILNQGLVSVDEIENIKVENGVPSLNSGKSVMIWCTTSTYPDLDNPYNIIFPNFIFKVS